MGTFLLGSKRQSMVPSFPGNKYYSKNESEAIFIDQNELNSTLLNYLYLPGRAGGQTVYKGVNIIGQEDDTQLFVMASGLESTGVFSSFINSSNENVMSLVSYPNGMGGNARVVIVGDNPYVLDPLSRITFSSSITSNYANAVICGNNGLGAASTANFIVLGDKTTVPNTDYVPTYAGIFGHTNSNWADPGYTLFNPDSSFCYSSDGDFFTGAGRGGNLYLFAGSIANKSAIKMTVDGTTGYVGIGTTTPDYNFHVVGDGIFENSLASGLTTKNFYVDPVSGVDSGFCDSPSAPGKTIQYVLNRAVSFVNTITATINLAAGTYQENVTMPTYGSGKIIIQGTGATKADVVWKAATPSGTSFTHTGNNWTVVFDKLTIQNCAISLLVERANVEIGDISLSFTSIGILLNDSARLTCNAGNPYFDGNSASSYGILCAAKSSFVFSSAPTIVNTSVGIALQTQASGYLYGVSITPKTGSLFGIYVRSQSTLSIDGRSGHTCDINFPSVTSGSVGIQITDSVASITAGSIFNTTNAYYRTNINGYSHWNEGNTCTYNDTNVTVKAYCEYSAEVSSQNYLGTGAVYNILWFSSYAGSFPNTFGFDVSYFQQKVNNSTTNDTLTSINSTQNVDASGGNKTVTLPSAVTYWAKFYVVRKSDSSTNTVTITPFGTQTINGAANYVLRNQYESIWLQSDGFNWFKVNNSTGDFLYKPGIAGGQTAYGGTAASDNLYLYASNHPAPGTVFIGGNTKTTSLAVDAGGYTQIASLGIGVAPDLTGTYGLYIKQPGSAGIKFESGAAGYAFLYYLRAGVAIGYLGLGSLTNNSLQIATYSGNNAPVLLAPGGVPAFYVGDEVQNHIWTQYNSSSRLFSIGLDRATETPIAKLHVKDGRDGSTDRIAFKVDTAVSAWTNLSKLAEFNLGGNVKAGIGPNGTYSQIKPAAITTVAGVPYTLTVLSSPTANRRFKFNARFAGKESGNAGDIEGEVDAAFYRYSTGNPVQRGSTVSKFFQSTNPTDTVEWGVSGTDIILTITTATAMTIQFWINYEINTI